MGAGIFLILIFCLMDHKMLAKTLNYFFFAPAFRQGFVLRTLLIVFFIVFITSASSVKKPKKIESIPFEMVGSYMVVKVRINDSSPLNLILDSGVRNIIITELLAGDQVTLIYSDVTDLMGLGGGAHLNAFTSNFNTLKIGKLNFEHKTVYVLQEDVFNLTRQTGTKINGLLGVDFFQDYLVEINYTDRRIRFYDADTFGAPKGYQVIPITFEGKKMFIQLSVLDTDSTKKTVKMLVDTGAELNAWFQSFTAGSVQVPAKTIRGTIGQGLNGIITGFYGSIPQICLGEFCLKNPIVSFPDSISIGEIVRTSRRDGTLGSQILSRFNLFIDYKHGLFYFKPNSNLKKGFYYNVAGIEVAQIIPFISQTEVMDVWENSPADKAGVLKGDQIMEINGRKTFVMSMQEIKSIFQSSTKIPLYLVLKRADKEIEVKLDMKSRI